MSNTGLILTRGVIAPSLLKLDLPLRLGSVDARPLNVQTATVRAKYNKRTHKRCIKCRDVKEMNDFGTHPDQADGHQVICKVCKNIAATKRRNQNVPKRLHHHIATRVTSQLGSLCPPDVTARLEEFLGYTMVQLVKHLRRDLANKYPGKKLRDVLNEGWHVDHIYPLSRYPVCGEAGIDWTVFKRCWKMTNLSAIPAADNLAKGAKVLTDAN